MKFNCNSVTLTKNVFKNLRGKQRLGYKINTKYINFVTDCLLSLQYEYKWFFNINNKNFNYLYYYYKLLLN